MPFGWVAGITAVAGAYSANKANSAANKATDAASASAGQQAEIAGRQQDLAELQYADSKKLFEEYQPLLKQGLTTSLEEQQKSITRGDEQWGNYQRDFAPLEQKLASTALNFDTPQRREQAAGDAVGQVSSAFDIARAGTRRSLADAGVKVGSGAVTALDAQSRIEQAKASAGASNQARSNVEMQGLGLLDNATRFGRNMPSTGLAVAGLAGQQGQQAQGAYGNLAAQQAAPTANAIGGLGAAANTAGQSGQLYLNSFQPQFAAAKNSQAVYGDIAGAALKMYSSRTMKDVGKRRNGLADAQAVKRSPSHNWRYRAGLGDGDTKSRPGPMAEDLNKVAPDVSDGKQIDVIGLLGLHHSAIGGQQEQLDRIEKKLGRRLSLADAKPKRKEA